MAKEACDCGKPSDVAENPDKSKAYAECMSKASENYMKWGMENVKSEADGKTFADAYMKAYEECSGAKMEK